MEEGPEKKPNHQASGEERKQTNKLTYKMCCIFSLSIMWGKQKEDVLVRLDGTVNRHNHPFAWGVHRQGE